MNSKGIQLCCTEFIKEHAYKNIGDLLTFMSFLNEAKN